MGQNARTDEEHSTARRAEILHFQYYDTSDSSPKQIYKDLLSVEEIRNLRVVPLAFNDSQLIFGILNNTSPSTINNLKDRFNDKIVQFNLISETGFKEYLDLYDPPPKVEYQEIEINSADQNEQIKQISSILLQVNAQDMLAYLVEQAHRLNASDIHIETKRDNVLIRYRIDGVLHPIAEINYDKYRVLIGAIASQANISTSSRAAQQGHISQRVKMANDSLVDVNVRVESVQTINSMDVVMRLFNLKRDMYNLDRLGLNEAERKNVDQIIAQPTGLVMIVGPTGSGKTTTLYSMINALSSSAKKIITIEDPVEYQFNDITQISVNNSDPQAEGSFADNLKAILRLDPDILMVGEIRDNETAKIALQAALTGHLVLTTFHAGSSSAALTRLYEIIGQNTLFTSSIRLVMAQRLVRALDDSTKQPYHPQESEFNLIKDIVNTLPDHVEKPSLDNLQLYRSVSTESNPFGYKGQLAIREQFILTPKVSDVINNSSRKPTTAEIESAARDEGMITMKQDAILKVIAGQTTLDEVLRVLGLDD